MTVISLFGEASYALRLERTLNQLDAFKKNVRTAHDALQAERAATGSFAWPEALYTELRRIIKDFQGYVTPEDLSYLWIFYSSPPQIFDIILMRDRKPDMTFLLNMFVEPFVLSVRILVVHTPEERVFKKWLYDMRLLYQDMRTRLAELEYADEDPMEALIWDEEHYRRFTALWQKGYFALSADWQKFVLDRIGDGERSLDLSAWAGGNTKTYRPTVDALSGVVTNLNHGYDLKTRRVAALLRQ